MNKVILIGRLTADPEVRYTQGENTMAVARYTLAVDRRRRGNEEQSADFIRCVAFDKRGEFAEKYLRKGSKIAISGHIQTGNYTNRDGVKVYTTDVVVEDCEFAESKASDSGSGNAGGSQQPANNGQSGNFGSYNDGFMNIPDWIDEELPFH